MFQIGQTLVSEEIISNEFVCNLSACKGACCVAGEAGAPLETKETIMIEKDFESIKDFLSSEGLSSIEKNGKFIKGKDGELETPLIKNKECAYVVFNKNGVAQCGIENAYDAKKINWKKPISCHLYPIRVKDYSEFSAINYHKWHVCESACDFGSNLNIPVYKFVKEALIRKFGHKWYMELEDAAKKINF